MRWLLSLFVIWKWTPDSFVGVWRLDAGEQAKYVNLLPGGNLRLLGVDHSRGYWEKKADRLCLGISKYGSWKLYKGHVHDDNDTTVAIRGDVLSGQMEPHYEGGFEIEPAFFQFHTVRYEADDTNMYHGAVDFEGVWLLENTLLTSNYKSEKGGGRMRRHIVKRIGAQVESRVIQTIRLLANRTWYYCDVRLNPTDTDFRGVWGLYNDTHSINFNSAVRESSGRGIWLKSNRFEKVFIVTNVSSASRLSGLCVESYCSEPEIDSDFHMYRVLPTDEERAGERL